MKESKDYWLRFVRYQKMVSQDMAKLVLEQGGYESHIKNLWHIRNANINWLRRIERTEAEVGIWDEGEVEQLVTELGSSFSAWEAWLGNQESGWEKIVVEYANSKGQQFSNIVIEVLMQIMNHAEHHRARIIESLLQDGVEVFPNDYIFYIRSGKV